MTHKHALWLILVTILIFPSISMAQPVFNDENVILSIIGEGENQGYDGMIALAWAIHNRGTLKGVYGLHAPRVIHQKYTHRIYLDAKKAWEAVKKMAEWQQAGCVIVRRHKMKNVPCHYDPTEGATHWENINAFGKPYWVNSMNETYRLKDHVFYK